MLGGIWQLQGGWSATTHKEDFNGDGNNVNTGAWYTGIAYALNLGGRNTNFNITYGESYNAAQVPMPLSNASPTFGQTISGIKNNLLLQLKELILMIMFYLVRNTHTKDSTMTSI